MRRSQEKKSIPPTTTKKAGAKNAPDKPSTSSLEKAYGSSTTTGTNKGRPPVGKTSSLVAASKASYAEKYGTKSNNSSTPTAKVVASTSSQKSQKQAWGSGGVPSTVKGGGSVIVKPVVGSGAQGQQRQGTIGTMNKPPQSMAKTQKPTPKMDKPKLYQMPEDNYDDDDFEEDYKSDFEAEPDSEEDMFESGDKPELLRKDDDEDDEPAEDEEISGIEGQQDPQLSLLLSDSASDTEKDFPTPSSTNNTLSSGFFQKKSSITQVENNSSHQVAERPYAQNIISTETGQRQVQLQAQNNLVSSGFNFDVAKKGSKLMQSHHLMNLLRMQNSHSVTLFHLDTTPEKLVLAISGAVHLHKAVQVEKAQENHDTQTDPVQRIHKWTQRPPTWSTNKAQQLDIMFLREESLGVGTESVIDLTNKMNRSTNNNKKKADDRTARHQMEWDYDVGSSWSRISKFISRASTKVLYVLESQKRLGLGNKNGRGELEAGALSEAKLGRGLPVFNSLEMACLTCSGDFLACANYYPAEKSRRKNESKSVITIWSMKEPSHPKWYLRMWGKVTALTLFVYGHLVVAGGNDGGLAIWNLDENPDYHKAYQDQTIRTATIDTALLEYSHHDVIVGLHVIQQTEDKSMVSGLQQLYSMDRSGIFKSWSIHRSSEIVKNPHYRLHTAYWSMLNLSHKSTIHLNDSLAEKTLLISSVAFPTAGMGGDRIMHCVCGTVNGFTFRTSLIKLKKDEAIIREYYKKSSQQHQMNGHGEDKIAGHGDPNHLSNNGHQYEEESMQDPVVTKQFVLQKYNHPEHRASVTAVDVNSTLQLCLVGSTDGKCRLYSLPNRKLLTTMVCGESPPLRIHFSRKRLSVFYIALPDAILVYDFLKSETRPWKTFSIPNIKDLEIYFSVSTEFTVVLASNELKASLLCGDFSALSDQEHAKFTSRLNTLLLS